MLPSVLYAKERNRRCPRASEKKEKAVIRMDYVEEHKGGRISQYRVDFFVISLSLIPRSQPSTVLQEENLKTIRPSNHFIPTTSTSHYVLLVDAFCQPSVRLFSWTDTPTQQRWTGGRAASIIRGGADRDGAQTAHVIDLKLWGWRQLVNL